VSERRQILLVEDSETQALKLSAMLEHEGLTVERVVSAEHALTRMGSVRPDLVVVDYHLPGMQGDEFCRLLRMNSRTETVPLLILTDDTERDVERHGLESGADDHVTKSSDPEVLLARIQALLRQAPSDAPFGDGLPVLYEAQHLLLIDDSPTYLVYLEAELVQDGYRVDTADGGEAALAQINRNPYDCIVVDLVMPGMDGIELCRRLASLRRNTRVATPVLMVTGKDSKEDMMRALEAGADDFVSKSSDIAILKARIRAMLRRKLLRDEREIILSKFRDKELELLRERGAKEAAEARAGLVRELEDANRELKNAHIQLVQTAKMASLGELVAGIAHEVNNPIAYSIGHATTIERSLTEIAEEVGTTLGQRGQASFAKARQRIHDLRDGLRRVSDLVTKLRTFSRLDEGEFKRVDMREGIESALTLMGHRLKGGISIRRDFTDDNWLYCAQGPLNQVVINLLGNAIDAVGAKGEITISTRRVDGHFVISVSDTGPGVPPALRERVFEPFFTTKDVGSGTGLGLALSYKIVERHHGRIEIGERPGGGAVFAVRIPCNLEERNRADGTA
jgi:two-component system NtrC family sensor kinase